MPVHFLREAQSIPLCFCGCTHTETYLYCMCARVFMCSVDSLIPRVAWVGEGLQLDSRICHSMPSLGLNDSPVNVLLQVDEAPVVAERHPGRNVVVLYEKGVPDSVCTHDIVHVHADSVADFGRQGGCGGGRIGLTTSG